MPKDKKSKKGRNVKTAGFFGDLLRKFLGTSGEGLGAAKEKIKKKREKEKELLKETA